MTPEEREKWAEQFSRRGFASLPFVCLDIMQEYARAAVQAERDRRNAAWRQIVNEDLKGHYTYADLMALGWRVDELMKSDEARTGQGEGEAP